jgi:molybdate-binding protein/DNA-binding XRE family transcriptional regulator
MDKEKTQVTNRLAELRGKRGMSAAALASKVGVSRQTVYAIEAGTYIPNTVVSLRMARVLDVSVEELFELQASPAKDSKRATLDVILLSDPGQVPEGQSVRLCRVGTHIVAVAPEPGGLGVPPTDALMVCPIRDLKRNVNARVQVISESWKESERLLIAGCDPSAPILASHLQREGCELVIAYENSSRAVELLHEGFVHVAGTHSLDGGQEEIETSGVFKDFSKGSLAVFRYADWEEGFVVAPGNPKNILAIRDLTRAGVSIANREPGAACRVLLDKLLEARKIPTWRVQGYDRTALGQLPAARLVQNGEVDCCISTRASARALGLAFIPLVKKPYLLAIRRSNLQMRGVQTLLNTLGKASFRREVEAAIGYDMRMSGERVMGA